MTNQVQQIKAKTLIDDDSTHKKLDLKLLRRLGGYLAPHRTAALSCLAISIVTAMMRLGSPLLIHHIIDEEIPSGATDGIVRASLALLGLMILIFISDIIFNITTQMVGQKSMHDLRIDIFRHVTRLDVAFFDRTPVGRLITRMTSDVATLNDLFSSGVIAMIAELTTCFGLVAIMFYFSVPLTLVVLCALPFMYLIIMLFRGHARKWYLEGRARLALMNAYLQENIAGMKTVQSFNREGRNHGRFSELNDHYKASQIQTIMGFAAFFPALNLILYTTLTGVIWIGGRSVIEQSVLGGEPLQLATLFLFVQTVNMLFTPLRTLSEKYNLLQAAMASSARIFSLLDTKPNIVAPADPHAANGMSEGIRFDDVSFEYVKDEPVVRGVSFKIKAGQTVAVVGATGAGKSTLINLLTRFYDVKAGRIEIDGVDVRAWDPLQLRRLFAVVLQEVFLFSDTIGANIRLTNPGLTDDQIWELLRQVHAEEFVRASPLGLETQVMERGSGLSTGQKQLLAFARALASDPRVLILDEATANIDTATEHRIQEAIATMLEGRTALVIAHRLSTIQKADLIIAMHHGQIHEMGTHAELIKRDGLYRKLYELQFKGEAHAPETARAG